MEVIYVKRCIKQADRPQVLQEFNDEVNKQCKIVLQEFNGQIHKVHKHYITSILIIT
jgi:predicted nucleic acid-binding Zn ribbon protein